MSFLKAHFFKYTKENPGKIFYKNSFSEEEESKTWDITKKKKKKKKKTHQSELQLF